MRDATVCNVALAAAKQLGVEFLNKELTEEGVWVRAGLTYTDPASELAEKHRYMYVSHQRYRDPKIALLTYAHLVSEYADGTLELDIDLRASQHLRHCTAYGLVLDMRVHQEAMTLGWLWWSVCGWGDIIVFESKCF